MSVSILATFKDAGVTASFHYADNTGSEWGLGDNYKRTALKLFDNNPDLQSEMRVIAKGFLWSLGTDRKTTDMVEEIDQKPVVDYDQTRPLDNNRVKDTVTGWVTEPTSRKLDEFDRGVPNGRDY